MPFWLLTRSAKPSARCSIAWASRSMISARRAGSQLAQPPGSSTAWRAAATAASMSASAPSGTWPSGSSVLALTGTIVRSVLGAAHVPPM